MTYPQPQPLSVQGKMPRAAVLAGPICFAARAPYHFYIGPDRQSAAEAQSDADYLDQMFAKCPAHQWACAAMAGVPT